MLLIKKEKKKNIFLFKKKLVRQKYKLKKHALKKIIYKLNSRVLFFFFNVGALEYFLVNKVLNHLMVCGKKDKAYTHWIQFQFQIYLKKIKIEGYKFCVNPGSLLIFVLLRGNVVINLKKKKVAGRTHNVPLFLDQRQQWLFTLKNYISGARLHVVKYGIISKLVFEFLTLISDDKSKLLDSQLYKKKRWLYAQAIENKFYIKFL